MDDRSGDPMNQNFMIERDRHGERDRKFSSRNKLDNGDLEKHLGDMLGKN